VTRLILWRHGQTAWNAESRVQGQLDVELSELGRQQAIQSAPLLAARQPDLLVASDLRRAADTAAALAELTGLQVSYDTRLRERCFGEWQGHTLAEVKVRWPDAYARWRAGEVVGECGIEDVEDLAKRTGTALEEIASAGGTIVVATHGGSARHGAGALLGWPEPVARTLGGLANCHWTELGFSSQRGWQLLAHNVGWLEPGAAR
jgi:probable phosphoglycerate mutase